MFISVVSIWLIAVTLAALTVLELDLDAGVAEDMQIVVQTAVALAANSMQTPTVCITSPVRLQLLWRVRRLRLLNMMLMLQMCWLVLRLLEVIVVEELVPG